MVKSNELFSPQNYLHSVTGLCYIINGDNDIAFIESVLSHKGYGNLWNYPLSEIDHIVENDINVVLVDCMMYDKEAQEFKHELRWFEVPEDWDKEAI